MLNTVTSNEKTWDPLKDLIGNYGIFSAPKVATQGRHSRSPLKVATQGGHNMWKRSLDIQFIESNVKNGHQL